MAMSDHNEDAQRIDDLHVWHRAWAEAGVMPWCEYVKLYGTKPAIVRDPDLAVVYKTQQEIKERQGRILTALDNMRGQG